jgi:hypothetical protein
MSGNKITVANYQVISEGRSHYVKLVTIGEFLRGHDSETEINALLNQAEGGFFNSLHNFGDISLAIQSCEEPHTFWFDTFTFPMLVNDAMTGTHNQRAIAISFKRNLLIERGYVFSGNQAGRLEMPSGIRVMAGYEEAVLGCLVGKPISAYLNVDPNSLIGQVDSQTIAQQKLLNAAYVTQELKTINI